MNRMNLRLFWPLLGMGAFAAPPTPPPMERSEAGERDKTLRAAAAVYSIGDPTPEEQLYIELINRARANPTGEAQIFATTLDASVLANLQYYNVNLLLMQ